MNVLKQWFSYRSATAPARSSATVGRPRRSNIQPDHWPHEYTTNLLDLLNVLARLVQLEPAQAALLDEILAGLLLPREDLEAAEGKARGYRSTRNLKAITY
jgi:hypothetical protein